MTPSATYLALEGTSCVNLSAASFLQDSTRKELRALELDHAALKVTCQTRKEEIEKLQEQIRLLRSGLGTSLPAGLDVGPATSGASLPPAGSPLLTYSRLLYVKRSELIRRESLSEGQPNRYCRVMAYNETHGMLVVSQVTCQAKLKADHGY